MGQVDPLTRHLLLLRSLSSRSEGSTLRELADELGVSTKTVRRAITTLQEAGFAVVEKTGPHGRKTWHIETTEGLSQLSFTFDEALALYLGRRFLTPLMGTMIGAAASRAFQKIRSCLGNTAVEYLDAITPRWHVTTFGAVDYSDKADILDQLLMGLEEHKVVNITYRSLQATEPVTYPIHPYAFIQHRSALYVIGHSPNHGEHRIFKVNRIEAASKTVFSFEMPEDFDLKAVMANAFGVYVGQDDINVKVRFQPSVARYIEESTWHPSQKLTRQRDGSVLAEFQLSDSREFKAWVMSFGCQAEVLEPPALRQEIAEELLAAYDHYAGDASIAPAEVSYSRDHRGQKP